jgi:ADP-ribose pyrophosphatase
VTDDFSVASSETVYTGRIMGLRVDEVRMPGGGTATRQVVEHPGAVVVLALDRADGVVLIRQYRHPVGEWLVELPAGLLDVAGEPPLATARRELAEEAGLVAARWDTLLDLRPSPGLSEEATRVYLARDLTDVAEADRHVGTDEETDLGVHRMPLDEAVAAVFAGRIENAATVAGLLAAAYARDRSWTPLRPADAPWAADPTRRRRSFAR